MSGRCPGPGSHSASPCRRRSETRPDLHPRGSRITTSEAFLGVNTWEGVEWFSKESFETLLDLAVALDRADGVSRTSAAIGKLRRAAEEAGYRVDQFLAALQARRQDTLAPTLLG